MKGSYLNDGFFSRLETMTLNLNTSLSGYFGGKHLVNTYGQTVEFADFREYQLGDDIRRIDWNLFSRFEKYFLKLFTDERQMQVQIFLDCSASMGKDNVQKGAYAVATAAALGFLAVHNMDKLSFQIMQGSKAENPFGNIVGKTAFFRAVGELENIQFGGEVDIERQIGADECEAAGDDGRNAGFKAELFRGKFPFSVGGNRPARMGFRKSFVFRLLWAVDGPGTCEQHTFDTAFSAEMPEKAVWPCVRSAF